MEALEFLSALPKIMVLATVVLTVLGLLLQLLNTAAARGRRGEAVVKSALLFNFPAEYKTLHNITLPTGDGTTQIDHVIVSPYGVFCLETKTMQGWIFGSAEQRTWTQVIYKKKTQFQNPLRQNYKHTETIRSLLNLPKDQVHSVIAFVGSATFKTTMPENVGTTHTCLAYINRFKTRLYPDEEVQRMVDTLQAGRLEPTRATHRLHVQNLQKKRYASAPIDPGMRRSATIPPKAVNENTPATPTCPKCGSPMVLRTARKGTNAGNSFWGCGQYPKCRGTRVL